MVSYLQHMVLLYKTGFYIPTISFAPINGSMGANANIILDSIWSAPSPRKHRLTTTNTVGLGETHYTCNLECNLTWGWHGLGQGCYFVEKSNEC